MTKMTWDEFKAYMIAHKAERKIGYIVYTEDSWEKSYNLEQRTYVVYSSDEFWDESKPRSSLFGYCLDGKDLGVRLDWYRNDWKVEYCYIEDQ